MKNEKKLIYIAVSFVLVALFVLFFVNNGKESVEERVIEISKEQMYNFTYPSTNEIQYYYFSRSACPDCEVFNSGLNEWCDSLDITLLYYDAQQL